MILSWSRTAAWQSRLQYNPTRKTTHKKINMTHSTQPYIEVHGKSKYKVFASDYPHGRLTGLRSETTLMIFPSTEIPSPAGLTSASKIPRVESYLRRWEACLIPPVSLMTTTSRGESFLPCQHLKKFLPILPKPLMATFTFISTTPLVFLPPTFIFTKRINHHAQGT